MEDNTASTAVAQLHMEEDKTHRSLVPDDVIVRDYLSCVNDDTWVRQAELVKLSDLKESEHEDAVKKEVLSTYIEERMKTDGVRRDPVMEAFLWQEEFMKDYKENKHTQDRSEATNYRKQLMEKFRKNRSARQIEPRADAQGNSCGAPEGAGPVAACATGSNAAALPGGSYSQTASAYTSQVIKPQGGTTAEAPAEYPTEPEARPAEAPAEHPTEPEAQPAEAPAEYPTEPEAQPAEAPAEHPTEPEAQPAEAPAEYPTEPEAQPAEAPAEYPTEPEAQPAEAPAEYPTEPEAQPAEAPAEYPTEPEAQPAEAPAEYPTEPEAQPAEAPAEHPTEPEAQPAEAPAEYPTEPEAQPAEAPAEYPTEPEAQPAEAPAEYPTEPEAQPAESQA
ncbi:hypothetical protein ERJ75_001826400 [Trypanosoma vivax]|uniref:Uncharacterized protein n=1 Tax=Trypanosoma vivax (strain Y486) TaxID=1055687 RepID=G0U8Z8_TRYVY|nr:hypothetical protein ERJ75_001826400 [Trypanosoma vivax]CCC54080.1 conserved hypothetical protein [Trypanosoma vivax Y486]